MSDAEAAMHWCSSGPPASSPRRPSQRTHARSLGSCFLGDLAAEDPLGIALGAASPKEVHLEVFEVEKGDEGVESLLHGSRRAGIPA